MPNKREINSYTSCYRTQMNILKICANLDYKAQIFNMSTLTISCGKGDLHATCVAQTWIIKLK